MNNPLIKYVDNRLINIDHHEMQILKQKYSSSQLSAFFDKLDLKFPYKKYYIFDQMSIKKRLELGMNYEPEYDVENTCDNLDVDLNYRQKYKITNFLINYGNYDFDVVSDTLTEKCRVKAWRKNLPSLYQFFKDKKLRSKWFNFDQLESLNAKVLRDLLYYNLSGVEVTNFSPTVALALYLKFKPKKILDMSSGWGDRLFGAIVYDARNNLDLYCGIDPNECLFEGYQKLIDLSLNPFKFKMINDTFENAKIPFKFDLMFSSPPYFDFEKYSKDGSQSYIKYQKLNDWLHHFLFVSIDKIYELLEINGYMCLNISDTGKIPYVHLMIEYIEKNKGFRYVETIGYRKTKICRPIYIYQKIL